MTLAEVKEILDAEVVVGHDRLDLEIEKAGCADLMSDVLVFCKPRCLLLTGLINPQVVRTADVLDIAAIVMVRGKHPLPETSRLAEELRIPILATRFILFEAVGRLYSRGIASCIQKIDEIRHSL